MDPYYFDNTTKAGTAAGTLLSIFANINSMDLIKTALLAAVGALVSFWCYDCIEGFGKAFQKIVGCLVWLIKASVMGGFFYGCFFVAVLSLCRFDLLL